MSNKDPIIPISFDVDNKNEVDKCFKCGSEDNLLCIEEDSDGDDEGKYICNNCLINSRTYKICERDDCDVVFKVRRKVGECDDYCIGCNEKMEIEESHDFED